jgi:hypothetical protein
MPDLAWQLNFLKFMAGQDQSAPDWPNNFADGYKLPPIVAIVIRDWQPEVNPL